MTQDSTSSVIDQIDNEISCTNLSKTINGVNIVSNVSLAIKRGEIIGIIGTSGAGKSTIFKMLSMMISKDAGEIDISGVKVDGYCKQYAKAE